MAHNYMKYGALSALLIASINMQAAQEGTTRYTILTQSPEQHIQHFGASDAWSMQFLGLWSEKQQEQIADWLFSTENDALGKPKGIGLSIWRFNLGAGSEEQGEASQIQPGTRTQCFLNADGTYDWSKQAGQRKFLKLAKQRGVPYFLAFCNSAPVFYTKNGLATNTGRGGTINLKDDCYGKFGKFIATSLKGIEEHDGIHFNYISPINEPDGHWNWTGPKQEGTPATNREFAKVAKEVSKALVKNKLNTEILINESSDYRCLLGMKQKLGLAQAIMEGQDILILDEPFNALDYKTYEDVKTIIRMLKAEGKTIFLTSHHYKDIEQLCDQVYSLEDCQLLPITEEIAARYREMD